MTNHSFGDRVRVQAGATGRYVGYGLALAVSAMDNDLFLSPVVGTTPHPTLPVPSDDALAGAAEGLRYARYAGWHPPDTSGDEQP